VVPVNFGIRACFDGSTLILRDNLRVPVIATATGLSGSPSRSRTKAGLAADATRLVTNDPTILLPGEAFRAHVGTGPARVTVRATSIAGFYLEATTAARFAAPKRSATVGTFAAMVNSLVGDFAQRRDCDSERDRVARCTASWARSVVVAIRGAGAAIDANKLAAALLTPKSWEEWLAVQPTALYSRQIYGIITLAPARVPDVIPAEAQTQPDQVPGTVNAPTTPTPLAPQPTPPPPATGPPPTTATTETSGGLVHTWTDYSDAGGSEGPSIPSNDTVDIACKVAGFAVADGDTWWYRIASSPWNDTYYGSADAFYNNGQTSGTLVGTPFVDQNVPTCPAGAPTPSPPTAGPGDETSGGVVHTWTDYSDAGGSEGPSIPSNDTVHIACKVAGFAVADGNTWWYRIASSPWNGTYYGSADAFYNNGQISGTLIGTPFVDPSLPDC
jgi:hypothetical protein